MYLAHSNGGIPTKLYVYFYEFNPELNSNKFVFEPDYNSSYPV